jgi:hypothetical protein
MDIIRLFEKEFSNYNWELEEEGKNQYRLICNHKKTFYHIFDFVNIHLPGFYESEKESMLKENIDSIISDIKKSGINFMEENNEF